MGFECRISERIAPLLLVYIPNRVTTTSLPPFALSLSLTLSYLIIFPNFSSLPEKDRRGKKDGNRNAGLSFSFSFSFIDTYLLMYVCMYVYTKLCFDWRPGPHTSLKFCRKARPNRGWPPRLTTQTSGFSHNYHVASPDRIRPLVSVPRRSFEQ